MKAFRLPAFLTAPAGVQRRQGQRVGEEDPFLPGEPEPEVALDRRQGNDHHGRVDEGDDEPRIVAASVSVCRRSRVNVFTR